MITLLTDFGLQDVYVGVMKGVIKSLNPDVDLIDLTHEIPRQNILAARFALMNAIDFFPDHTIHLAVVDPTVGSKRKALAIAFKKGYLICPNNGIFSGVLSKYKPEKIVELTNKKYWFNSNPSSTFHGRDIFAAVAGYLSQGISLNELGEEIKEDSLVELKIKPVIINSKEIIGTIQYIDIYGNLVTNIAMNMLNNKSWYLIEGKDKINNHLTYSSVNQGDLLALIGSHGWLEIAVNGGSAKIKLNKEYNDQIRVRFN
ncbi:SAM-dependent chlorinase/fluorinase [Geminocystis sp. GBBB08]|uniref:SAM hydrolase/SAM-dependent halogenase family protein n=1 Tax=Geminocystis sp. GBBB08 TaxID=2604140 RepID=UPI0027E30E11|nr:SAM-dependent chlorinase/fluorinase [Geminocystis sp. GBBB08]MBL1210069.1 SAM-dependent chlorinase/fluorinase [Geminocystis sp. GBBB08]